MKIVVYFLVILTAIQCFAHSNVTDSVYNVRTYGAVGDSITDDAAAIQNTINAAVYGGNIYFPAGQYRIGSNITFPAYVRVEFACMGMVKPDANIDIYFAGSINAGVAQIFTGDGNIRKINGNEEIFPEWWGANALDLLDDYSSFERAFGRLQGIHKVVLNPQGRYIWGASLSIPHGWRLEGHNKMTGAKQAWNDMMFSNAGSTILLANNASLEPAGSCSIIGINILKNGLSWPQNSLTNYTGTAINVVGSDVTVSDCTIIGFDTGISSTNANVARDRLRLEDINMDCKSFCVRIENTFDNNYLSDIHCWPFGTAGQDTSLLVRPGYGFYLKDYCHGTNLTNCFAYGYMWDYWMEDVDCISLLNCFADYHYEVTNYSVGFVIVNSGSIKLTNCTSASMDVGYNLKGSMAVLNNCEAFQIDSHCVLIDDPSSATSYVKIANSVFKNSTNGVVVNKNDSRVSVGSNIFKSLTGGNILNLQSTQYLSSTDNMYW